MFVMHDKDRLINTNSCTSIELHNCFIYFVLSLDNHHIKIVYDTPDEAKQSFNYIKEGLKSGAGLINI